MINKFATVQSKDRRGFTHETVITSDQMAQIGLALGWITPRSDYGRKLASGAKMKSRGVLVKTASGSRKIRIGLKKWLDLSIENGWITHGMNKVAGFWSAVGDMAGSAVNAVGNAWQGAKNLVAGGAKFLVDAHGKVTDTMGRLINATVNTAGQVVDAAGRVIGQAANAAAQGAKNVAQGAVQLGRFAVDGAGRVLDASGRVINATVNAAGQVVDAAGRVIGQAANYVGQLAGEAKAGYDARREQGGTNFLGSAGEMATYHPAVAAGRALGGMAVDAGNEFGRGYGEARRRRRRLNASDENSLIKMSMNDWARIGMDMGYMDGKTAKQFLSHLNGLKIGEERGYTKSAQVQLKAYSIDYALGILNSISTIIKGNDEFGKGISGKIAMLKNEMGKGKKMIYTTPKAMGQLEGFINAARALYGWDEIWMTEEQYAGSSLNQGQTANLNQGQTAR